MTKVFVISTFLGLVNRGIESTTQENFAVLSRADSLETFLFKGGGSSQGREITPWNPLLRASWAAEKQTEILSKLARRKPKYIKKFSFFFSLLPYIVREKPDVIYFGEIELGRLLAKWRRFTKQNYKLLFRNDTNRLPPFPFEHIQQINPSYWRTALAKEVPPEKQTLLPYGFEIPSSLKILTPFEKEKWRNQLDLPEGSLAISVGAVNAKRKRMDYVIREVARLPEPRPYLLLLGHQDGETPQIVSLGKQLLGERFSIRTVPYQEIVHYYRVADAFVFASTYESFGRVYVEALSQGLPCLAHDYDVSQFVLGEQGYFADLTIPGNLMKLLTQVLAEGQDIAQCHARHQSVYERFSWDKLKPKYVDLIERVANENIELPLFSLT